MKLFLKKRDYFIISIIFIIFIVPYYLKNEINLFINEILYKNNQTFNSDIKDKLGLYNNVININKEMIEVKKIELENLFYIQDIEKYNVPNTIYNTENYSLTSIITFGDNIKKARVNGKFYNEGETIDGIKIDAILKSSIILNFNGDKKEIFITKNRVK